MNSSKLERNKDTGNLIMKYVKSFKHSVDGLVYAIENEINILFLITNETCRHFRSISFK